VTQPQPPNEDGISTLLPAVEQPPEQPSVRLRPAVARRNLHRCDAGRRGATPEGTQGEWM